MSGSRASLAEQVAEILILWPHLDEALERDGGQSTEERVSGTISTYALPVNADVLSAVATLNAEVPAIASWAAGIVAEPFRPRSIPDHLRHIPRWHERMLVTAAIDDAARLVASVRGLLRDVKMAIGLRTPDRRLGQFCPMHDVELRELIAPGDEGALHYRRLDQAGRPIQVSVSWDRHDCALCRHCGASWGPGQYLMLGRLLREADARRTAAEQAA